MLPPAERNCVALAPGGEALEIRISFDEETQKALLRGRDRLMEILEASGHRPSLELWHVEAPGTSVHYGGTARMHQSPRFGMLDGWNRVHAAPNVLVVDSAAFTTGPEKNPTLTAMALASRACQRLAADLRSEGGRIRTPRAAAATAAAIRAV
jgi:choline dehydrogenase-like flavoprotein